MGFLVSRFLHDCAGGSSRLELRAPEAGCCSWLQPPWSVQFWFLILNSLWKIFFRFCAAGSVVLLVQMLSLCPAEMKMMVTVFRAGENYTWRSENFMFNSIVTAALFNLSCTTVWRRFIVNAECWALEIFRWKPADHVDQFMLYKHSRAPSGSRRYNIFKAKNNLGEHHGLGLSPSLSCYLVPFFWLLEQTGHSLSVGPSAYRFLHSECDSCGCGSCQVAAGCESGKWQPGSRRAVLASIKLCTRRTHLPFCLMLQAAVFCWLPFIISCSLSSLMMFCLQPAVQAVNALVTQPIVNQIALCAEADKPRRKMKPATTLSCWRLCCRAEDKMSNVRGRAVQPLRSSLWKCFKRVCDGPVDRKVYRSDAGGCLGKPLLGFIRKTSRLMPVL